VFLSTSEPYEKGAAGGILGSSPCRVQEQGSNQSTSIRMEQMSNAGILLYLAHPQQQEGNASKDQS